MLGTAVPTKSNREKRDGLKAREKKERTKSSYTKDKNEEDEKDKRMDQSGKKRVTKVKEGNEGKGRAEGGSVMLDESCAYWAVGTV